MGSQNFDWRGLKRMAGAVTLGMLAGFWLVFGRGPSLLLGFVWVAFAVGLVGLVMHFKAFFRDNRNTPK